MGYNAHYSYIKMWVLTVLGASPIQFTPSWAVFLRSDFRGVFGVPSTSWCHVRHLLFRCPHEGSPLFSFQSRESASALWQCSFTLCEDSEDLKSWSVPPAVRRCPEPPRGQQPWQTHCLDFTCELLARGCDPRLPTLLRDIMHNQTQHMIPTYHWMTHCLTYMQAILRRYQS